MFTSFFGNDEKLATLQSALNDENFVQAVLNAITALPDDGFDALRAAALFRLVPGIRSTSAFEAAITSDAALASVLREFTKPPQAVLNAQWAAVRAIATDATLPALAQRLPRLIAVVEPAGSAFAPFQVAALALLQSLIAVDEGRAAVARTALPETIAVIAKHFPRHTTAHRATVC
jgi:hypothetical protein